MKIIFRNANDNADLVTTTKADAVVLPHSGDRVTIRFQNGVFEFTATKNHFYIQNSGVEVIAYVVPVDEYIAPKE
jgi:hypothetical protein